MRLKSTVWMELKQIFMETSGEFEAIVKMITLTKYRLMTTCTNAHLYWGNAGIEMQKDMMFTQRPLRKSWELKKAHPFVVTFIFPMREHKRNCSAWCSFHSFAAAEEEALQLKCEVWGLMKDIWVWFMCQFSSRFMVEVSTAGLLNLWHTCVCKEKWFWGLMQQLTHSSMLASVELCAAVFTYISDCREFLWLSLQFQCEVLLWIDGLDRLKLYRVLLPHLGEIVCLQSSSLTSYLILPVHVM